MPRSRSPPIGGSSNRQFFAARRPSTQLPATARSPPVPSKGSLTTRSKPRQPSWPPVMPGMPEPPGFPPEAPAGTIPPPPPGFPPEVIPPRGGRDPVWFTEGMAAMQQQEQQHAQASGSAEAPAAEAGADTTQMREDALAMFLFACVHHGRGLAVQAVTTAFLYIM